MNYQGLSQWANANLKLQEIFQSFFQFLEGGVYTPMPPCPDSRCICMKWFNSWYVKAGLAIHIKPFFCKCVKWTHLAQVTTSWEIAFCCWSAKALCSHTLQVDLDISKHVQYLNTDPLFSHPTENSRPTRPYNHEQGNLQHRSKTGISRWDNLTTTT